MCTRTHHLSVPSHMNLVHVIPSHFCKIPCKVIFPSTPWSSSWSQTLPPKVCVCISTPGMPHVLQPHPSWFDPNKFRVMHHHALLCSHLLLTPSYAQTSSLAQLSITARKCTGPWRCSSMHSKLWCQMEYEFSCSKFPVNMNMLKGTLTTEQGYILWHMFKSAPVSLKSDEYVQTLK